MTDHLSNLATRYDQACSTVGQVVKFQRHEKCILFGDTGKDISSCVDTEARFCFLFDVLLQRHETGLKQLSHPWIRLP